MTNSRGARTSRNVALERAQLPQPAGATWRRLGELLLGDGLLSDAELSAALSDQASTQLPLGEIVVTRGYISRLALLRALARQRNGALELECGFGSGLFDVIDRRNRWTRPGVASGSAHTDLLRSSADDEPAPGEHVSVSSTLRRLFQSSLTVSSRAARALRR